MTTLEEREVGGFGAIGAVDWRLEDIVKSTVYDGEEETLNKSYYILGKW